MMPPVHVALLVLSLVSAIYAVPVPLNTTNYHTVLMIGAHPDDIEACSGGLANQLHAQGSTVIKFYRNNVLATEMQAGLVFDRNKRRQRLWQFYVPQLDIG